VALATLVRELDKDLFKVSLRSRCRIDVAEVARKFGGGGHLKAAGFRFKGKKEDLIRYLLEELGQQIELHKIRKGSDFLKNADARHNFLKVNA